MSRARVHIKASRIKALERRHPWIFSGAIERMEGAPGDGDTVDVIDSQGKFRGRGFFNTQSQIRVRVVTWQDETVDRIFLHRRVEKAIALRQQLLSEKTTAYRLVNAEGDGLPGLIVDRYGDFLVVQISSKGMEAWRDVMLDVLMDATGARGIYERSEGGSRREDGLRQDRVGTVRGEAPESPMVITENGLQFVIDVVHGQKTGFYLDQRENRKWVAQYAEGRQVLNCFGYTGAFSVYAAKGKAAGVTTVDSSAGAISLARENFKLNKIVQAPHTFTAAEAFDYLRSCKQFDFIILDPPAFVRRKTDIKSGGRGYKDINLQAFRRLNHGGLLLTCSCSHHVDMDLFQKIVFGAAQDAGRFVRVIGIREHGVDHPVSIYHPEGKYLKAMLLAVE